MELGLFSLISQAFQNGGIWMWAIFAAQILSVAIIAERIFHLYVVRSVSEKGMATRFEQAIKTGKLEKVVKSKSPIGKMHPIYDVARAGAQAAIEMGGSDQIQAKMDEILLHENEKIGRLTGFLAVIGNVGTLLGLLGTIVGLIQSFASVANLNPVEKSTHLTQGIALAMNTTAYGLIVAIPALVMYAVFQNRTQRLSQDLNQGALKVYNWLRFSIESVPRRPRAVK